MNESLKSRVQRRRAGRRCTRVLRDRGEVVMQTAILFPVIVVILFGCIQTSFYFLARASALEAAQMGVDAQRGYQVNGNPGANAASTFLSQTGGRWLVTNGPPQVRVAGGTVTVTITGKMRTIIPGMSWTVTQSASGPVELVTP